jgi:fluoride exporter
MQNAFRPIMAIALGAIPGALGRYYLTELAKALISKDFSYYGTFFINVTGCLILAWFYTLSERKFSKFKSISPDIRLVIATGFCGAYTTFSTYGLETFTLLDQGDTTAAFIYGFSSMVVGMMGVKLGVMLGSLNAESDQVDI